MKLPFGWIVCTSIALSASLAPAQMDRTTLRFIGDVLLGTEYGPGKIPVCFRWTKAPTLSVFADGDYHPNLINSVVKQINECLPETMKIQSLEHDDESATLKVFFCPQSKFEQICREHQATYIDGNLGYYAVRWNEDHEIEQAIVLLDDIKLRGNRLQHFLVEELTQSMGAGGDSSEIENSVFYEDKSQRKFGSLTRLSRLDRKLVTFLYHHVEPGMTGVELGVVVARSWSE